MSKEEICKGYDPNDVGIKTNNVFGLPYTPADAALVFIPVPWDVTTSNFAGTSEGPGNILKNSYQIDLFAPAAPDAWKRGMAIEQFDTQLAEKNKKMRHEAQVYIHFLEEGGKVKADQKMTQTLQQINEGCEIVHSETKAKALSWIRQGKLPFLIGGDHSISSGLIEALNEQHEFGILQIDAHADLRKQYMGFTHSHASVMHRALHTRGVQNIVQAGIRELCPEEQEVIIRNQDKIKTFFDHQLHKDLFHGRSWESICNEIVEALPEKVYITFDVDGLQPSCCPGTGTPVPGGLSYNQAVFLIEQLLRKNKQIIGADLVETGPMNMDGIVSSRLLFQMASIMIKSNENR